MLFKRLAFPCFPSGVPHFFVRINYFNKYMCHYIQLGPEVRFETGSDWSRSVLLVLEDQWTVDRTGTVTSRTETKGPVLSVAVRFSLGLFLVLGTGPLSTRLRSCQGHAPQSCDDFPRCRIKKLLHRNTSFHSQPQICLEWGWLRVTCITFVGVQNWCLFL